MPPFGAVWFTSVTYAASYPPSRGHGNSGVRIHSDGPPMKDGCLHSAFTQVSDRSSIMCHVDNRSATHRYARLLRYLVVRDRTVPYGGRKMLYYIRFLMFIMCLEQGCGVDGF